MKRTYCGMHPWQSPCMKKRTWLCWISKEINYLFKCLHRQHKETVLQLPCSLFFYKISGQNISTCCIQLTFTLIDHWIEYDLSFSKGHFTYLEFHGCQQHNWYTLLYVWHHSCMPAIYLGVFLCAVTVPNGYLSISFEQTS